MGFENQLLFITFQNSKFFYEIPFFVLKWSFIFYSKKTVLLIAVEKGNKEIVQLLLSNPNVDVNAHLILNISIINIISK